MTKKELENLHSNHCTVERVTANRGMGPENRIVVCFSLTEGQFNSLTNALALVSNGEGVVLDRGSPIVADLVAFIRNAKYRANM